MGGVEGGGAPAGGVGVGPVAVVAGAGLGDVGDVVVDVAGVEGLPPRPVRVDRFGGGHRRRGRSMAWGWPVWRRWRPVASMGWPAPSTVAQMPSKAKEMVSRRPSAAAPAPVARW